MVEPIKFLINENILNKMKKFYDSQMVPFESENLLLKAHAIGCDIEVTSDYEASFLGQNAVHEAKHWSRSLAKKIEQEKNSDHLCMHPHIGAAETGSADFLGPLCVVACYADDEALEIIKNLKIDNVDDLSNQEIINCAKLLKGHLISSLLVLDNSHYNKMIDSGINQANIRARLFNQAVVNVLQKVKKIVEFKVIDQFVSPKTYYNYLKSEVIVVKDMIFETNADEQYLAVLAAEIISRYAYLQYFASMTKSLKMNLARGAGTNAEIVAVKLANKYGEKILTKVCKLNFTNTKRVKGALKKLKEGL